MYIKQKVNLKEALLLGQKALALDPKNSYLYWNTIGAAYLGNGQYEKAVKVLENSLALGSGAEKPRQAETFLYLGKAYWQMGLKEKAQEAWRKVIDLCPRGPLSDEARKLLNS